MEDIKENTGWELGGEVQEQYEALKERQREKKRKKKPIYRTQQDQ